MPTRFCAVCGWIMSIVSTWTDSLGRKVRMHQCTRESCSWAEIVSDAPPQKEKVK